MKLATLVTFQMSINNCHFEIENFAQTAFCDVCQTIKHELKFVFGKKYTKTFLKYNLTVNYKINKKSAKFFFITILH